MMGWGERERERESENFEQWSGTWIDFSAPFCFVFIRFEIIYTHVIYREGLYVPESQISKSISSPYIDFEPSPFWIVPIPPMPIFLVINLTPNRAKTGSITL